MFMFPLQKLSHKELTFYMQCVEDDPTTDTNDPVLIQIWFAMKDDDPFDFKHSRGAYICLKIRYVISCQILI